MHHWFSHTPTYAVGDISDLSHLMCTNFSRQFFTPFLCSLGKNFLCILTAIELTIPRKRNLEDINEIFLISDFSLDLQNPEHPVTYNTSC
jgi:hypothetical protein